LSSRAGSLWNWATQIGAKRFTTACSALASAMLWAVAPLTHPPHVNPMIMVAMTEATHDQKSTVFVGRAAFILSMKVMPCLFWSIASPPSVVPHVAGRSADTHIVAVSGPFTVGPRETGDIENDHELPAPGR
jgi:hypothetical protein